MALTVYDAHRMARLSSYLNVAITGVAPIVKCAQDVRCESYPRSAITYCTLNAIYSS